MPGPAPRFWYTESLQAVQEYRLCHEKMSAMSPLQLVADQAQLQSRFKMGSGEDDAKPVFGDGRQDYMMQRYKNVALINISGSLVNRDSWYNRYYGMVSYQEIRRSVMLALADPAVDAILAMMNTPGGSASGADSMSSFFSKANKQKGFYAFAESDMCSGGYYLGAPARKIYAQRAASVGSIGVIMVHFDMLKMYEEFGIEPTVFRAGEFKALGTPYEHLDKKAKDNIQSQLKNYFDMFNDHVTMHRGFANSEEMRETAGEGRVFMAEEAKSVGLVDYVAELEDTLEDVSIKASKDAGRRSQVAVNRSYGGSTMSAKKNGNQDSDQPAEVDLDAQTLAALASGASQEQLENVEKPEPQAEGGDKPAVEDEGGEPQAEGGDKPEVEADAGGDKPEEKPASDASLSAEVVRLSKELGQAQAKVSALEGEKATLATQVESQKTTIASQRNIVAAAVGHRQVALGFQPNDTSAMSDEQLVTLYGELDSQFKQRYSAGQKSTTSAGPKQQQAEGASLSPAAEAAKSMIKI